MEPGHAHRLEGGARVHEGWRADGEIPGLHDRLRRQRQGGVGAAILGGGAGRRLAAGGRRRDGRDLARGAEIVHLRPLHVFPRSGSGLHETKKREKITAYEFLQASCRYFAMSLSATATLPRRAAINPKPLGVSLFLIVLGAWFL